MPRPRPPGTAQSQRVSRWARCMGWGYEVVPDLPGQAGSAIGFANLRAIPSHRANLPPYALAVAPGPFRRWWGGGKQPTCPRRPRGRGPRRRPGDHHRAQDGRPGDDGEALYLLFSQQMLNTNPLSLIIFHSREGLGSSPSSPNGARENFPSFASPAPRGHQSGVVGWGSCLGGTKPLPLGMSVFGRGAGAPPTVALPEALRRRSGGPSSSLRDRPGRNRRGAMPYVSPWARCRKAGIGAQRGLMSPNPAPWRWSPPSPGSVSFSAVRYESEPTSPSDRWDAVWCGLWDVFV